MSRSCELKIRHGRSKRNILDTLLDGPLSYSFFLSRIFFTVSKELLKQMANHKSAEKRMRQAERRNQINRGNRAALRTEIKRLRAAVEAGNREEAQTLLPKTVSVIDKAIQKGILHKNAAARHKSRLTASVTKLTT